MSKDDRGRLERIRCVLLGDLRKVLLHRHRGRVLSNDDAGRDDLDLLLRIMACAATAAEEKMLWAVEEYAPWLPEGEARPWIDSLLNCDPRRIWVDGKELGWRLNLTSAEREFLRTWSIRPVEWHNLPPDEIKALRKTLRKERDRDRKAAKRRQNGAISRPAYEANSKALRAEATALGISYDAMRKRRQRACPKSVRTNTVVQRNNLGHSLTKLKRRRATVRNNHPLTSTTGTTSKAAPPISPPLVSTSDTLGTNGCAVPVSRGMDARCAIQINLGRQPPEWDGRPNRRSPVLDNWWGNACLKTSSAVSPKRSNCDGPTN